ncbi:MAG TPA: RIP metalloprotease RseP [Thermoanaerobaculia bacterium]|nr:RIP metalloprotease RseP [Thermoanaerobaculia bacterium]
MIFSNVLTNLAAFVLVLGFLIFAHEAAHFIVAKLFGVRVLVFSFGFGQRLFGVQRGDTDYRVSLIPLGGYVRMAGDIPEERTEGDPDEFLSRPKWQRFLILFAGPFMNVLIAVAFLAGINMVGTETVFEPPVIGEVVAGKPAANAGLQVGDRIVAVDGSPIHEFGDMQVLINMNAGRPLRFEFTRSGVRHTISVVPEKQDTEFGPVGKIGIGPWIDPVVGSVDPNSAAARAGVKPGDRIASAAGQPIANLMQLNDIFSRVKGAPVAMDVVRNGTPVHLVLPAVDPKAQDLFRGIYPPTTLRKLAFLPAIEDSLDENWTSVKLTGAAIGRILTGEGSVKEFSGPITIARVSGSMLRRGFLPVVFLMAMLSLQLGIMNLLPIPVLDGGHIMVLLVEGAARRDLSIRTKERVQQVGLALLAALFIVVIYNDVITNVILMKKG